MPRSVHVVLIAASGLAAIPARGDEPGSPRARFEAIRADQEANAARYHREFEAAGAEPARAAARDRYTGEVRKNAEAALDLARDHPRAPAAVEALRFVVRTARAGPGDQSTRAIEVLRRDHTRDPGAGMACFEIFSFFHLPAAESFIRAVLDENPAPLDRGKACHALATYLRNQAKMLRRFREHPDWIKDYEDSRGPEPMARFLREEDADALDREADAALDRVIAEFGSVLSDEAPPRPLGAIAAGELFGRRNLGVGRIAPEIAGTDVDGRPMSLSDHRGKVVVLTFSGEWCGPCRAMYPGLKALGDRWKDRPFAIVSVDTDEEAKTLRAAIASGQVAWPCWFDGGPTGPITTRWGISSFPGVFVLDPAGVIRFKEVRGEALDRAVESLMPRP